MKKLTKIISLLLILGISFYSISFAIEDKIEKTEEEEQLLLQQEEDKKIKKHLQKKVIISKFILKKQLGIKKVNKYSKIMNKILSKYGENEEVLTRLETRLEKIGEKKLTAKTKALFNYINYNIKYKLLVYKSSPKRLAKIEAQKALEKQKALEEIVVVKKKRRSGGGGGGGSRYVAPKPVVKDPEPEPEVEPEITDLKYNYNGTDVLSLYVGDTYTGSLSIDQNTSVTYAIINKPVWFDLDANTGDYTITPTEIGDSLLDLKITSTSGTKVFNDAIRLSTYPSDFIAHADSFPITNSTDFVTDFVGSITHTDPRFVPNPDGLTWTAIFPYYSGYGDGVQVITVDLSTGIVKADETAMFAKETWHMFEPVFGEIGMSFVNIAHFGRIIIHSYNTNTHEWEANVSGTYEEHRSTGQRSKIAMGTNGKVYSLGRSSDYQDLTVLEYDPVSKTSKLYDPIPAEGNNVVNIAADDEYIYTISHPYGERILTAYNMATNEQTVLKRANSMHLSQRKNGVILLEGSQSYRWLHEGQIKYPSDGDINNNVPWGEDNTDLKKSSHVYETPINRIDTIDTKAMVPANGTTGKFWYVDHNIDSDTYVSVNIPNITRRTAGMKTIDLLQDGKILMSTSGYKGYAIYDPETNTQEQFITAVSKISNYAVCVKDNLAYITGYFGGALLKYDVTKPWINKVDNIIYNPNNVNDLSNPYYLGPLGNKANFGKAYACAVGNDGRVYLGGEKVRSGDGGGVASYDPTTDTNTDYNLDPSVESIVNYTEGFEDGNVHGIVAMGDKMVISSHSDQLGETILLTIIDTNTQEIVKTIRPTTDIIKNSGRLLADLDQTSNMVYLYTETDDKLNLRFLKINIESGEVIWSKQYPGTAYSKNMFMSDDGFIYAIAKKMLIRIDPVTGNMKVLNSYTAGLGAMQAIGDRIYHLTNSNLRKLDGFKVQYSDFELSPFENTAPEIDEIEKTNLSYGELKTYQINSSDIDEDTLNYFLKDEPDFVTIDNNGLITFNPLLETDKGQHTFTIVVDDGIDSTEIVGNVGVYMKTSDLEAEIYKPYDRNYSVSVSEPIVSVLPNTEFMVPNADGLTWDVLKVYMKKYFGPNELVIIDGETGDITRVKQDYNIQQWHLAGSVVAPNGKLFISVLARPGLLHQINIYDPVTNELTINAVDLPLYLQGETGPLVLGTDNMIYYGGSYKLDGDESRHASAVQINPDTLEVTEYGKLGPDHNLLDAGVWGYSMAVDDTHAYIASGKIPWYLVSYNKSTQTQEVILETTTIGGSLSVAQYKYGVMASITGNINGSDGHYWIYNGIATLITDFGDRANSVPWDAHGLDPMTTYKDVELPAKPIVDFTASRGGLADNTIWFNNDDTWERKDFTVDIFAQELTKSLVLSDGRILVAGKAYGGFGMYNPETNNTEFLGKLALSPNSLIENNGKIYLSGYPSSSTFEYDPTKPWTQAKTDSYSPLIGPVNMNDQSLNPRFIGYLREFDGVHTNYANAIGDNGNVYFGGKWKRDGYGGGVAWYDPSTQEKGGMSDIFSNYQVNYMTNTTDNKYIVISTRGVDDQTLGKTTPTEGRIFILDPQTNTIINTYDPVPEVISAGKIIGIDNEHIIGMTGNYPDDVYIYKLNVVTGDIVFKYKFDLKTMFIADYTHGYGFGFELGEDGNIRVFFREKFLTRMTLDGYFDNINYMDLYGFLLMGKDDIYMTNGTSLRRLDGVGYME